ncbi:hypothetical protein OROHE_027602 [Orobanche hederae]
MSPQTETKASVGFKAGVKDKEYKLTYYIPEYKTKDTDILAAFRVTPQPEVPPEQGCSSCRIFYWYMDNCEMYLDLKPCVLYVWKICEFLLLILKFSKARPMRFKLK